MDFARQFQTWAEARPEIQAVVLIGSHAREASDGLRRADEYSDWDFHVITSRPELFRDRGWVAELPGIEVLAYSVTPARVSGLPRVTAIFSVGEVDIVILPLKLCRLFRLAAALGAHRKPGRVRRALQDLALVIRPGWRFLKRHPVWEDFFRRAVERVPDPRLDDPAVLGLAEAFFCHWDWIVRKARRGELRAAARLLHRELEETNIRLLHELRVRRGEVSFPEARRIERIAPPRELEALTLRYELEPASLENAANQAAEHFRRLVGELVGERWRWPAGAVSGPRSGSLRRRPS